MNELFPKIVEDFYARLEREGASDRYYVAGGACRDYLLRKEIRDIDIYVLIDANSLEFDMPRLIQWVRNLYPDHKVEVKGGGAYDNQGFVVLSIDTEIPIDFVVVAVAGDKDIKEVVDGFTCHLSQVYMERQNGDVSFVCSDNFKSDISVNTITFDSLLSDKYRNKLVAKYPERRVRRIVGDIFK